MNTVLERNELLETKIITDYGLVSIIMPNYNSAKFIKDTIDSVVAQTYQNWELLFVDDCSTDKSLEIVRSFEDERIRIFQNDINSGAAVSRNYALREARGKWIAFLDSDDLWENKKLEKQLEYMVSNNYDFTYTRYVQIDDESNPMGREITGPQKIGRHKMFQYDYIGCLTVIYNAEKTGVIQIEPSLKNRNDYAIWLKVCKFCECHLLDERLARYRIRKKSLSHSGIKNKIKGQYRLYRYGENMCVLMAGWHTIVNMFFGVLKKVFYTKTTNK